MLNYEPKLTRAGLRCPNTMLPILDRKPHRFTRAVRAIGVHSMLFSNAKVHFVR